MYQSEQQKKLRARELGIPFQGITGKYNAITDVQGVEVGFSTINNSKKNIHTGVTAIFPRGKINDPVFANWYALNGNGELTGTTWITESGFLETPILITNTNSVGVVRDTTLQWFIENKWFKEEHWYIYPVVGETYDGWLNDINGFHVTAAHTLEALNNTVSTYVEEGNVGGGNAMICFGFKGGTGTSSRLTVIDDCTYTTGVLVQANFGKRKDLTIAGIPVGRQLENSSADLLNNGYRAGQGSIIAVVATDAPLLPHQLKKLTTRVSLGVGRLGGQGDNGSGDIFLAFSTANKNTFDRKKISEATFLPNEQLDPLFEATIQCIEEAVINALVAAETMSGMNGQMIHALPVNEVLKILKDHNRM